MAIFDCGPKCAVTHEDSCQDALRDVGEDAAGVATGAVVATVAIATTCAKVATCADAEVATHAEAQLTEDAVAALGRRALARA